jgi:hypothetical protein
VVPRMASLLGAHGRMDVSESYARSTLWYSPNLAGGYPAPTPDVPRQREFTRTGFLRDATSSLGDATSSLGDATSLLGDAESSLGDATSSPGDAKSSLGDAKSSLGDAESSLGDAKSSLGDVLPYIRVSAAPTGVFLTAAPPH